MGAGFRDFTADTFRQRIGEVFVFAGPAGQQPTEGGLQLKLLEVNVHGKAMPGLQVQRQPFSLVFVREEEGSSPGQGLFRLEHKDFEAEEWLLARVQVSGRGTGAFYEAVIS